MSNLARFMRHFIWDHESGASFIYKNKKIQKREKSTWICRPHHCSSLFAYFHLDTVLFTLIVLHIYIYIYKYILFFGFVFSSVSACLLQRLSFSLGEIKTMLNLFSLCVSVSTTPTFSQNTSQSYCTLRILEVPTLYVCVWGGGVGGGVQTYGCLRWHAAGWCARNRLCERASIVERQQAEREDIRQVCAAYVVTWRL